MQPKLAAVVVLALVFGLWVDDVSAQNRVRRSLEGPVTREAVTRTLAVIPEPAGGAGDVSELSLMLRVEFAFDSALLTGRAMRDLDEVGAALNGPELASVRLMLEGHADARGSEDYNLRLSQQRAEAVRSYLIVRGVSGDRLRAAGYGEYRLLPEYPPTDERQRRVEIVRTF